MKNYLKPSVEVVNAELESMLALSVNSNPAVHDEDNPDGDGLVKCGIWDDAGSFWTN